jgi:hypothetical protein
MMFSTTKSLQGDKRAQVFTNGLVAISSTRSNKKPTLLMH